MSSLDKFHALHASRFGRHIGIDAAAAAFKALAALAVTTLSLVALLPQPDIIAMRAMLA